MTVEPTHAEQTLSSIRNWVSPPTIDVVNVLALIALFLVVFVCFLLYRVLMRVLVPPGSKR